MLKQVQHDVLRLSATFIKNVTLNLFQGLIWKSAIAKRNEEKSFQLADISFVEMTGIIKIKLKISRK